MTSNIYPDHYTAADIIADVIWTDEGTLRGTVTEAAQALKDSGRLMPAPTIIRTVEELQALDPDTLVQPALGEWPDWPVVSYARHLAVSVTKWGSPELPAVVVATGEQVSAVRKALKEATE